MINPQRKILITCALLYANGPIHLGHMVEYIQADIWARFQRMRGNDCLYICGNDAHGTPIMITARKLGIAPEQLITQIHAEHVKDFKDFEVLFDNFYTTHSPENQQLTDLFYEHLQKNGDIIKRTISQAYDPKEKIFLPDRYVKGECPRCGSKDQYGDGCEVCSATYEPLDLKNPISIISGETPVAKESEHYFFEQQKHAGFLQKWLKEIHLQEEMQHKLNEWFSNGLHDKDISRDAPYFGFKIPETENKYFYVWLDAPIGYMASLKNLCERNPEIKFEDYWNKNSKTELYHFIGKDIIYFHAMLWPALLHGAGYRLPTNIYAHGFLTIDGQKMSKSRGTFVKARTYLNHFNPEYIRYYFAAKLNNHVEDIDLNFHDFAQRINADLIGKVINIASRCASFIHKYFSGDLAARCADKKLLDEFVKGGDSIAEYFEAREFSRAVRAIMELADKANQYIDAEKPWALIKEANQKQHVHEVCSLGLNLFRILMTYLKPILPETAKNTEELLNISEMSWANRDKNLTNHKINPFKPLLQRITEEQITAMKNEIQAETSNPSTEIVNEKSNTREAIFPEVSYEDFAKIDLRIARIVKAEAVPEADKLLKLIVDIGGETRQIFAGIKSAYDPAKLEGKLTVVVANLAPRKMRFGMSEGMVLAAGPGGKDLWVLHPDQGAEPGMRVK